MGGPAAADSSCLFEDQTTRGLGRIPASLTGVFSLPEREVHIWWTRPDSIRYPETLSRFSALLSEDEREHHGRLVAERDRHLYLVAHALARCTLARYTGVEPSSLRFANNRYGRPRLTEEGASAGLSFNLSHTKGLAAIAIADGREVGIDVESFRRTADAISIADRYFSAFEAKQLRSVPAEKRRERFFTYWTLKEAYVKARGMGLSLPLKGFSFDLRDARAIRISFAPELQDSADSWRFELFRPMSHHLLAVAVRCASNDPLSLKIRIAMPLADFG